jgi:hypothetical protein
VAARHAEELLRAVPDEQQADDDSDDKKSNVHVSTSRRRSVS